MKIEDQVCSSGLGKELKKLKCPQDSQWYWILKEGYFDYNLVQKGYDIRLRETSKDFCSAFTVAELGIALPRNTHSYRDGNLKRECWVCEQRFKKRKFADNEANARAKMLICLIENGLVVVD